MDNAWNTINVIGSSTNANGNITTDNTTGVRSWPQWQWNPYQELGSLPIWIEPVPTEMMRIHFRQKEPIVPELPEIERTKQRLITLED